MKETCRLPESAVVDRFSHRLKGSKRQVFARPRILQSAHLHNPLRSARVRRKRMCDLMSVGSSSAWGRPCRPYTSALGPPPPSCRRPSSPTRRRTCVDRANPDPAAKVGQLDRHAPSPSPCAPRVRSPRGRSLRRPCRATPRMPCLRPRQRSEHRPSAMHSSSARPSSPTTAVPGGPDPKGKCETQLLEDGLAAVTASRRRRCLPTRRLSRSLRIETSPPPVVDRELDSSTRWSHRPQPDPTRRRPCC